MRSRTNSRTIYLLILAAGQTLCTDAWTGSTVRRAVTPAVSKTDTCKVLPWSTTKERSVLHQSSFDIDRVEQYEFQPVSLPIAPTTTESKIEANKETVLNGLLLAVCFGYAAYTIFNIDHGMTRGWTQSEIALRIPLDNWNNYETSLAEKPIYTKTLINVVIYLLGDWLAQTLFQGKNALEFDAMRTLRNGLIGLGFGPLVHEYYQFSDHILPVEGGMMNRVEKIFMDQTIYLTVKCSIYIMAVGLLGGDDLETAKNNVKDRIQGIVFTAWKFWPLVHCVTYGLIPARHRILWVNCVDLIWNAILATMSRSDSAADVAVDPLTTTDTFRNSTDAGLDPFKLTQGFLPAASLDMEREGLFEEETSVDLTALSEMRNATEVSLTT